MKSLRLSAPVYVCLSLCSLAYLRNHIPKLPNFLSILLLWPWLGPSCSGDAIRCVLPVLWTTQILRDSTGNNTGRGGVWVYRSGVLWWPYLSVCLCVSACVELHVRSLPIFVCMLPMAVARSSSGGVAIRYVPPVLWMTYYLHNVAAQLMEAQPTCSLGLGYKRRVGIPAAGQWTHTHGPTFPAPRSGPTRQQWACRIFMAACLHTMSLRI